MSLSNDPEQRRGDALPCTLRRLTHGDIRAAREIDRQSFAADDQYDVAFYELLLCSGDFDAMAAIDRSGALVGWALADLSRRPIRIRSVSVHPDCRRQGFGAALVSSLMERHTGEIDLLVERENAAAIALYQHLGFSVAEPDNELPDRLRLVWMPAYVR